MAVAVSLVALAALLFGAYVYSRVFRDTALWFRRRTAEAVLGGDPTTDDPMRRGTRFGLVAASVLVVVAAAVVVVSAL